ncbi:MAG: TIGR03905 family TSCPD domain-containing protein [Lachnospiraceae bacterium]|nr:TIGR03905 family TSCPD domain-containing protein [Lachnospiraceae bacterium]
MRYTHKNKGTCSESISFDINDGIVTNVEFNKGCNGNTKGIAKLVEGMSAEEVIKRLDGNTCGMRNTSCPDQLAQALKEALAAESK